MDQNKERVQAIGNGSIIWIVKGMSFVRSPTNNLFGLMHLLREAHVKNTSFGDVFGLNFGVFVFHPLGDNLMFNQVHYFCLI